MSTFVSMPIGEEIRRARMSAGLSQIDLAKLCESISNTDLSSYEKGTRNPTRKKLEIIAKALGKEWKLQ